MLAALVMLFAYGAGVWLVFFRFRWLKFSIAWGVVSVFFGLHLLLIFMIGLRFVTPTSTDARMASLPWEARDDTRRPGRRAPAVVGSAHRAFGVSCFGLQDPPRRGVGRPRWEETACSGSRWTSGTT